LAATALSACAEPKRIVTNLAPPSERLQCAAVPKRPTIPPEYVIDWAKVATVGMAKAEHAKFLASVRSRESAVGAYIIDVEGKLFVCGNNAAWLRDWFKATAAK